MAMNASSWIPNWFDLEVDELERQISNWCNLNAREKWGVVFNHNLVISWNEMEENWGILYQVKSNKDFNEILYQFPEFPEESKGTAYVNPNI